MAAPCMGLSFIFICSVSAVHENDTSFVSIRGCNFKLANIDVLTVTLKDQSYE